MKEKYLLICNNCGKRCFSDGKEIPFYEVKVAPIPKRADGVDKETKSLGKKIRCPDCGRLFKITKLDLNETPKQV